MKLLWVLSCLCLVQLTPVVLSQRTACKPSAEIVARLADLYNVKLYEPSLELEYTISVGEFSANRVQLTLNNTKVFFIGYTSQGDENSAIDAYFQTNAITAERTTVYDNGERKQTCKLSSSKNGQSSLHLVEAYENAIFDLTDYCLSSQVCEKIDQFVARKLRQRSKSIAAAIHEIALSNIDWNSDEAQQYCAKYSKVYNPQNTINLMVDFGVALIMKKVPIIHGDIVDLPNIDYSFKALPGILESSGDFQATDGTLQGMESLLRTKDIVLTNNKLRFSVATSYHLPKLSISYQNYKARFGIIKSGNGHVMVNIDGLTVWIKSAFDFNQDVCSAELEEFKLEHHGDINVDITGLWPFNTIAQNAISNIIRTNVLANAKDKVAEVLKGIDCEQYRPATNDLEKLLSNH